jgi:FkbM family methyltransferase
MSSLQQFARVWLPDVVRKPFGSAVWWFYYNIIQWVEGAVFDLRGGRFRADGCIFTIPKDQTSRAYRACFFDGSYEASERKLVRKFVRPTDSVLELGACLGVVSCVTNKILGDKTRHVVVEGNPFCIPTLQRNRELNHSGFSVENCAVSNEPDVMFYLHPIYIVGGTTQRESSRPVRVPSRSLAELDACHGPFNVLIMDIEGAELEIFSTSQDQLDRYRLVIVEFHPWAIGEVAVEHCRQLLTAAGLIFKERTEYTEAWQRD